MILRDSQNSFSRARLVLCPNKRIDFLCIIILKLSVMMFLKVQHIMQKKKNQLKNFIESHIADEIVTAVIIINAIALFLMTSTEIYEKYSWWLETIDQCAVIFFIAELTVRIYLERFNFFKKGWNIFDLVIIAISVLPQLGFLTALRTLRVIRVVRLIRFFPKMSFLINSLKDAVPGIMSVTFFLTLFFLVFSIMAFNLFKDVSHEYFGNMSHTLISMFQLMLNDNWAAIVRPIQIKMPYSNIFFISYTILMKFTLLNLFLGLIVNSMYFAAAREGKKSLNVLKTNLETVAELEAKIENNLEEKVDLLMEEIKSLRMHLNKQKEI